MENKRKRLYKTAILFFLFGVSFLYAQTDPTETGAPATTEKKNYFIREEEGDTVLYQHLSWEPVEGVFAFEFVLDKLGKNDQWEKIEKKKTKENYADVSLRPGSYRYKIAVINLLEQYESESDYRYFDVRLASQPVVSSISPKIIYFDDIYEDAISAFGKNFFDDTVFALTKPGSSAIKGKIMERNKRGSQVKVWFPINKINPGEYTFSATDISGLSDTEQTIRFKFHKAVDFYLSGGYAINALVGDKVFKEYFNKSFSAASGILRMTLVPIKRAYGRFGFNITTSGMAIQNKQEFYTLKAGILFLNFNVVYIYPIIKHRLHFDLHTGIGTESLVQAQFLFKDLKSPRQWFWGMAVNMGTAFQVFVYKKLYIEINMEHLFSLKKGFPAYILQPSLSIGWEF